MLRVARSRPLDDSRRRLWRRVVIGASLSEVESDFRPVFELANRAVVDEIVVLLLERYSYRTSFLTPA